ncbi:glycosyltransferase [Patescibacteria group bacterium]|nr:glycosyltransferase [Patescibacteria group bacterium]
MTKFSVCISVYKKDDAEHFRKAIESIVNQTIKPSEIILVVDGPVPEDINKVIDKFKNSLKNFKFIRLSQNKGHAIARQIGIKAADHELVALMDSDDISVSDRFEKQLACFQNNKNLDVVGGQIYEFINSIKNIIGIRCVPLNDSRIKKYLKKRCPFNQVTVMMRKSSTLKAGGYIDWYCEEDYYLWVRMHEIGCNFKNLPDNLVYVRIDKETYKRRGGWKYFKSEIKLQKYMLKNKIINPFQYLFNALSRFAVQILLPNNIRKYIFRKLFRKT